MPPKTRQLRCAYVESNQRCRRPGTGNPPLCEAHRIVIESEAERPVRPGEKLVSLLGRVLRKQRVTDEHVYGGIEDFVEMFARAPGAPAHDPIAAARARAQDFFRRTQAQAQGRPPPPPRPRGPNPNDLDHARDVLGFPIGKKLTAEDIKKRHRELARKHHPDRGGNVSRMQSINAAVDLLLSTL